MSREVDERVVEMRFDNKQFESAIADTQKSVKNFNKTINKEFGDSQKDFNKLEDAAESVRIKFNVLDMFKFEALHRVLSGLISTAENLVKSFTIDQVSAGWQKYADKTEAVQTIMNATGKSIDEVEEQLDKLNWFADETSYSFIDMTSNVGKFTAAGVELDKAVTAMQGISTWAALSGANTEQASRAMYNLSQAMAMGSVRVQDWMSIENANMATKEFKEMAIDAALAVGTLKKDLDGITYAPNTKAGVDVDFKNFRSTLSEGWLTDEVLTSVLEKYGKAADVLSEMQAVSDIDTTSELLKKVEEYKNAADEAAREDIFQKFINAQDLEDDAEAIKVLREQFDLLISDEYELAVRAFRAAQEAKTFKEAINATKDAVSTKWMNVFQDIFGTYEEAKVLWTDVSNILWDIFAGPIDNLHEATKQWSKNGGLQDVHAIITGILGAIRDVWQAVRDTINLIRYGTTDAEEAAEKKAKRLLDFTGFIRKQVENLQAFVNSKPFKYTLLVIGEIFSGVARVFRGAWSVIKAVFGGITDAFSAFFKVLEDKRDTKKITFTTVLEWIRDKVNAFADWLNSSGVLEFIRKHVGNFVTFLLKLPGKINDGFKKLTGKTIGEAFKVLFDNIKKGFKWVIDNKILQQIWGGIKSFFSFIGEGLKRIAGVETYGELFAKIKDKLVKIFTAIGDFFKTAWNKLKEVAKVENAKQLWDKIKAKVIDFFNFFKNLFSKKKKNGEESLVSAAATTSTAAKATDDAVSNIEKSTSAFTRLSEAVHNAAQTVKRSDVAKTGATVWEKIKQFFSAFFKAIGDFVKNIKTRDIIITWGMVKSIMKSIRKMQIAKAITDYGVAVKNVGWAVYNFSVAAKKYARQERKYATAKLLRSLAMVVIAFTAAVAVLAIAVYKLGNMDKDALIRGGAAVAIIVGLVLALTVVLIASMKSISKLQNPTALGKAMKKNMLAIVVVLLALSVVVNRLVKAIVKLAKIEDVNKLNAAAQIVIGLMAICFTMTLLLTKWLDKQGTSKKFNWRAVVSILSLALFMQAFASAILILAAGLSIIAKINPTRLANAVAVLAGIIALMILVLVTVSIMATPESKKKTMDPVAVLSLSVFFMAFATAVTALTVCLAIISAINPTNLVRAAVVLGIMMAVVTGIMAVTALLSNRISIKGVIGAAATFLSIGAAMVLMATAFLIMTPAIKEMSKMNFKSLAKVAGGIALILAAFALGGVLLSLALPGLIGFSVFLITLAAAISLVSVSIGVLGTGLAVLGAGISAFAIAVINSEGAIKTATKVLIDTLIMAIKDFSIGFLDILIATMPMVGALIIETIAVICDVLIQSVPKIAETIGVVLISILDLIITIAPKLIETVMTLIMLLLRAIEEHAFEIGELLMKILVKIVEAIAENIGPIVTAVFDVIANLFDALVSNIPRLTSGFTDLIVSVTKNTIGAVINGLFTSFGEALSAFAEAAGPFFEKLKSVDPNALNAVSALGGMMIAVTASSVLDGISKILSFGKDSPLVSFGKQLAEFAPYLSKFADGIKGINASQVEAAANAGKMLSEMYNNLPKSGGTLQKFFGESMSLETFGDQLVEFGKGFVKFYNVISKVSPIDQELVDSAAKAGKTLAGLYNALPKSGGVLQKFFGETMSLTKFGEELVDFAYGFTNFYYVLKPISPIDQNLVDSATRAGKTLAGLYNNLPKSGGVMQKFFGETMSLETFGKDLKEFATGFVGFNNIISKAKINAAIVGTVTTAALTLSGLYNNMPTTGGVLSVFFGETMNLKTFGEDLVEFAKGFNGFYTEITKQSFDEGIITTVSTVASTFAELYSKLPKQDNVFQDIFGGGQVDLAEFGTQLKYFGEGFNEFYKALPSSVDEGLITAATRAGETIAGLYEKLPKNQSGLFQDVFGGKDVDLEDFGTQLKYFGAGFKEFYTSIQDLTVQDSVVESVKNAGETMAGLYKSLNQSGITESGWIANIFGGATVSLSSFGTQLGEFGAGFKTFYTSIEGLDVSSTLVESVKNAGLSLVGLYEAIEPSGGWWESVKSWATQSNKENTFTGMTSVATSMIGVLATVTEEFKKKEVNADQIGDFMSQANNMILLFQNLTASKGIDGNKIKTNLSTAVNAITSSFHTDLESSFKTSGTEAGRKVIDALADSLNFDDKKNRTAQENAESLDRTAKKLADYFSTQLGADLNINLRKIGEWVAKGFSLGIEENAQAPANAATNMAQGVIKPAMNTLQERSPSRVFIEMGKYVSEGFAIGIRDYSSKAATEASDMGFETIDAISQAIAASRQIIGDNLDDGSMVLTPVLDLSEIQNGAAVISQMMSDTSGYAVGGTFDYANKAASSRNPADISGSSISFDKLSGAIEELIRNPQGSISNNFTINSTADPKEIAEEVSRIIETQVIRRQAVWGR